MTLDPSHIVSENDDVNPKQTQKLSRTMCPARVDSSKTARLSRVDQFLYITPILNHMKRTVARRTQLNTIALQPTLHRVANLLRSGKNAAGPST